MQPTRRPPALRSKRLILTRGIASLFLMTSASQAIDWNGSASGDWNTGANWNGGVVPGPNQDANIFTIGANIPTISADIISIPTDIRVGQFNGGNGRLNHTAGLASTGSGNWMTVGAGTGSVGVYNLTNTTPTGGTLTGFGTGSGSMTVDNSNFNVGGTGNEAGGTGTANINTTGILNVGNELNVGWNGGNGTVNLDAGTVSGNGPTFIARTGGTGTFNMSGGTLTRNGEVFVGVDANSTGALKVSGGTVTINNWLNVGRDGGTGSVTMTGGTMSVQREVRIGFNAAGNGTLALSGGAVLSGGTLPTETNNVAIGENGGRGTATVTGAGTQLNSTGDIYVGNGDNSTGTMTVSGGTVNSANWMGIGRDGSNGTLTINGTGVVNQGSNNTDGNVALELTNFSKPTNATVNLDGGTLSVNRIVNNGGGNTNIYLNGGTLKARLDRGDFLQGLTSATVKTGGAIIDTNGKSITINQVLVGTVGDGGLTKNGAGTLALGSTSTFNGPTTVNVGTLQLNNGSQLGTLGGDGAIIIKNGATLSSGAVDGLGYFNHTANNGITINAGGTLTALEGGRLSMDRTVNSVGGTITSVGTTFDNNASYAFRGTGNGPANSYNFTSSPGGVASTISAAHLGVNGATFNVTQGGGAVDLNVTGDLVDVFGNGGLTKDGNGLMILANANNTYTGGTTVSSGTLLVNGSIGASAVTVNGGTLGGAGGTVGTTTVNAGGTLAPGPLIATLNFAGGLTLAGTAAFQIDNTGFTLSADLANVTTGTLTLGGALNVTATGGALAAGDSFNLFDATVFTGSFTTVNLPALGAGLSWQTSSLGVNGTIAVVPEPTSFGLLAVAALGLGARRRRK